jgi:hypothetical protein
MSTKITLMAFQAAITATETARGLALATNQKCF